MIKMKTWLLLILLFPSVLLAQTVLGPEGYLNKLSRALRGYPPSQQEYKDLAESLSQGGGSDFVKGKKEQYLKSMEF